MGAGRVMVERMMERMDGAVVTMAEAPEEAEMEEEEGEEEDDDGRCAACKLVRNRSKGEEIKPENTRAMPPVLSHTSRGRGCRHVHVSASQKECGGVQRRRHCTSTTLPSPCAENEPENMGKELSDTRPVAASCCLMDSYKVKYMPLDGMASMRLGPRPRHKVSTPSWRATLSIVSSVPVK